MIFKNQKRTNRGKEHETGEDDDPEVIRVDYVAAIQLVEAGVRYQGGLV